MPTQMVMMLLSPEELEIRKGELAKLPERINEAREVANAERAKHRAKITEMEDRRDELVAIVTSSKEPRERKVEERPGLVNGAIELVDVETGQVVAPAKPAGDDGPLFKGAGSGSPKAAKKGEKADAKKPKGKLDVAEDSRKKGAPIGHEFSTGEPGKFRGADGEEYDLEAKDADEWRNGRTPRVQGKDGHEVEIMSEIRPPKAKKSAKNGAAEVQ